jgi:hypothetical protein
MQASGSGLGVGRCSRLLREVGVIAMPNVGLDITRCIEVPLCAAGLQLLVTSVAVRVVTDRRCVADGVVLTH